MVEAIRTPGHPDLFLAPLGCIRRRRREVFQQRPGFDEVGEGEALGEGSVDRREQVARLGDAALVAPEPGEVAGGAKLEQLRRLAAGDVERTQ